MKITSQAFSLILFFISSLALAQTVDKISGKSVLLKLEGKTVNAGSDWLTVSAGKRKTGWIKIKQVRGDQAVAEIMEGVVTTGQTLVPKPPPVSRFEEDPDVIPIGQKKTSTSSKNNGGVLLGYAMDTMSFVAGDANNPPIYTENANLTGTTYTLKGYYDSPFNDRWFIRYMVGLDGFNGNYSASNSQINKTGSGTGSNVTLSTLALEAEALWSVNKNKSFNYWLGAGYSFQYTMSSSTNMNSLSMSSSYSNVLLFGTGADFILSPKYILPVFINYEYYLAGKGITQNNITLAVGVGWPM